MRVPRAACNVAEDVLPEGKMLQTEALLLALAPGKLNAKGTQCPVHGLKMRGQEKRAEVVAMVVEASTQVRTGSQQYRH